MSEEEAAETALRLARAENDRLDLLRQVRVVVGKSVDLKS